MKGQNDGLNKGGGGARHNHQPKRKREMNRKNNHKTIHGILEICVSTTEVAKRGDESMRKSTLVLLCGGKRTGFKCRQMKANPSEKKEENVWTRRSLTAIREGLEKGRFHQS